MYLCNETKENKHKVQEIKCLRKPESDKLAGRGGCLASASGSFSNYELTTSSGRESCQEFSYL